MIICPNCGAFIRDDGALSCHECGSDRTTGWSKAADYAHLLPDDDGLPRRRPTPTWKRGLALLVAAAMTGTLWRIGVRWVPWVVLFAVVAFVLFKRFRGERSEHALFAELVSRCRDRELAERLIEAQRARFPNASRAELIEKALERLARDRR